MTLTREHKALFALLDAGLWGKMEPDMAAVFPLSDREWKTVLEMARQQTIVGFVSRGVECLPEEQMPPMGIMVNMMAYVARIEAANEKMNATIVRLWKHFEAKGIRAVLQKGQGVAALYMEPKLRECGDIDIYFPDIDGSVDPFEGFEGLKRTKAPDGSWTCWVDGIGVEQHTRLLDIVNPFRQKFLRELVEEKGFESVRIGGEDGVDVLIPAPEVNMLLLSSHILKHVLGVGIGLRQICDFAVVSRAYASRVDEEEMEIIFRRAGISKWNTMLWSFVTRHCEEGRSPDVAISKKSDILLHIILKGGNFGAFTEGREQALRNTVSRKLHTFRSFCKNVRFALRYAPGEWFWTVAQLIGGQLR